MLNLTPKHLKLIKKYGLSSNTKTEPDYALINEQGKVVETFRLKMTAVNAKMYYKKNLSLNLKIVRIK